MQQSVFLFFMQVFFFLSLSGIHHSHSHLRHHSYQSRHTPDHNLLVTDYQHLSALISSTISAHSLLVRFTVHYLELIPDPVCTYLCILTFQLSSDPPVALCQRYPCSWLPFSIDPAKTLTSVDSYDPLNCSYHLPFSPHDQHSTCQ